MSRGKVYFRNRGEYTESKLADLSKTPTAKNFRMLKMITCSARTPADSISKAWNLILMARKK